MDEFKITKPVLIQDAVFQALNEYSSANYYRSLSVILPAIEETACKHFGLSKVCRSHFVDFVNEHLWIADLFAGYNEEVSLSNRKFPDFMTEDPKPKPIKDPCFGKLCYYKMRCKLQHGKMIEDEIEFFESILGPGGEIFMHQQTNGVAGFPVSVIFGLIAMVIFAKANEDIKTETNQSLYYTLLNYGGSSERKYIALDSSWGWDLWLADEIRLAKESKESFIRQSRLVIRYRV